ncbi:YceI family protein [Flavihumibacter profundi]|jgi:polyisoprenoid-binding protein YceI|uniref:YceI family protein n=1 Tax=Flavihumibacter profundi TaxID=2716883 RepID=UPI001CC37680|nr:YceI family protein [Flavihumibacter profundi]MBZ5857845.1 YceI family protein [Flavihumibacter profundi]
MKKLFFISAILVAGNFLFGQTTSWKNDPWHSKLTFTVTHKGFSTIFGLFQKFDVSITSSKQDFSDAVFNLSVDVASINTEVKMRDDDLRSPNFFDVSKYPVMTFKSTAIRNTTGMKDRFRITGDLTMHGITKTVTMDLWFRGTLEDAMSKKTKAGFQLTGMISRTDFNVGPPDPFDISTDVIINADGEFFKQ